MAQLARQDRRVSPDTEVVGAGALLLCTPSVPSVVVGRDYAWREINTKNWRCAKTKRDIFLQENLVHNLACEEPRECKGFRKNLSGKWRRLVKKKQQQEVYTIPAELREQLKTIYVY
ncbi:hypothetical protein J6590_043410 [Homalodisca vitripennis]|nr:hypothetical protein J6590_043410 [Homalodisca vitripennis]